MSITINLSSYGFSEAYIITPEGRVFDTLKGKEVKRYADYRYNLKDTNGNRRNVSLKSLYRLVFKKEYCEDLIPDLPEEKWRDFTGTNGRYFISNKGRIKSYCHYKSKLLKPWVNSKGYCIVDIYGKCYKVHRLVALAFLEQPNPELYEVHHKDLNRQNNNLENL